MAGDRSIKEIISPSMSLSAFLRTARADLRCVAVGLSVRADLVAAKREKEGECHYEAPVISSSLFLGGIYSNIQSVSCAVMLRWSHVPLI